MLTKALVTILAASILSQIVPAQNEQDDIVTMLATSPKQFESFEQDLAGKRAILDRMVALANAADTPERVDSIIERYEVLMRTIDRGVETLAAATMRRTEIGKARIAVLARSAGGLLETSHATTTKVGELAEHENGDRGWAIAEISRRISLTSAVIEELELTRTKARELIGSDPLLASDLQAGAAYDQIQKAVFDGRGYMSGMAAQLQHLKSLK